MVSELNKNKDPVDLVLITGDIVAHGLAVKPKNEGKNPNCDSEYFKKTMEAHRFVADVFKMYLPDTPVFIALGNNDTGYHY
jgi:Icc-related predicted phosphoesterase